MPVEPTPPARRWAWPARVAVSPALLARAWWWSGAMNFSGTTYCERNAVESCSGPGFENSEPFFLWPITALCSLLVVAGAVLTGPDSARGRRVWAGLVAASVFVANRNNLWWAVPASIGTAWVVATVRRPLMLVVSAAPGRSAGEPPPAG